MPASLNSYSNKLALQLVALVVLKKKVSVISLLKESDLLECDTEQSNSLDMEVTICSETSVSVYQSIRRQIPTHLVLYRHRCEKLEYVLISKLGFKICLVVCRFLFQGRERVGEKNQVEISV